MPLSNEIKDLVTRGAIFYISHSAGKDSQAMYAELVTLLPNNQIVVVHADLGVIEWNGVIEHIVANVIHKVNVVRAVKTFFEMVERRFEKRPDVPSFPSSSARQCTSDLKRDPIHKFIRNDLKARGKFLAVNCTGIRAQESTARSKKVPFVLNKRLSIAGREVYEWMPIFNWTTDEVFARIAAANQKPFYAYSENKRLSCVFCIMGCKSDLNHGARQRPELFEQYVKLEKKTGYTLFPKQSLEEKAGITVNELRGIKIAIAA